MNDDSSLKYLTNLRYFQSNFLKFWFFQGDPGIPGIPLSTCMLSSGLKLDHQSWLKCLYHLPVGPKFMSVFPVIIRLSIYYSICKLFIPIPSTPRRLISISTKFLKTKLSRRRWFILWRGGVSKKLAAAFGGGVHHWHKGHHWRLVWHTGIVQAWSPQLLLPRLILCNCTDYASSVPRLCLDCASTDYQLAF
jgi:hypothetical protein